MINPRKNTAFKDSQGRRKAKNMALLSSNVNRVKLKRLSSYCVARNYDLHKMANFFKDKTITIYNSVVGCRLVRIFNENLTSNLDQYKFIVNIFFILKDPNEGNSENIEDNDCYIFIFDYGVIIFWNMNEIEEKSIISELKSFEIKSNTKVEVDNITYEDSKIENDYDFNTKNYISKDNILLSGNKFEEKLSVSYAIAQSSKLDYFEEDIDYSIDEARILAEELSNKGYISLDHISLNKKIGKLHLKKNEINLDTDILDIPDYFWTNYMYQQNFNAVSKYFEIHKRTEVINHRINIIAVYLFLFLRNYYTF